MASRFRRLAETHRAPLTMTVDGEPVTVLEGDTLLVALMVSVGKVRQSEFGDGARAGFCMMGACQDCWVWSQTGERMRACSTAVAEGLRLTTKEPEALWPIPA